MVVEDAHYSCDEETFMCHFIHEEEEQVSLHMSLPMIPILLPTNLCTPCAWLTSMLSKVYEWVWTTNIAIENY